MKYAKYIITIIIVAVLITGFSLLSYYSTLSQLKENYEDCRDLKATLKDMQLATVEAEGCINCLMIQVQDKPFYFPSIHDFPEKIEIGKEYTFMFCKPKGIDKEIILDIS